MTLERGKVYNYTLNVVTTKGAQLSSVLLMDWTPEDTEMDTELFDPYKAADVVYAIDNDGNLVDYATARASSETYQGVALVMSGKAIEIATSETISKWAAAFPMTEAEQAQFSSNYITKATETISWGYLKKPDGTYYSSSDQIPDDISTWTGSCALADLDGKANTDRIIAAGVTIANVINSYNDGSHGDTDWYLPAAGQLAYMFMNNDKLKSLMGQVSGADPNINRQYYSSSVISDGYVWNLYCPQGRLGGIFTTNLDCVRLVRDL